MRAATRANCGRRARRTATAAGQLTAYRIDLDGLARRSVGQVLGLPNSVRACLFDLDGVLTRTAKVHAAAWKVMFDAFVRRHAQQTNTTFVPFDAVEDYDAYVDGKPRNDGTRSFLQARGITLPEGISRSARRGDSAGTREAEERDRVADDPP